MHLANFNTLFFTLVSLSTTVLQPVLGHSGLSSAPTSRQYHPRRAQAPTDVCAPLDQMWWLQQSIASRVGFDWVVLNVCLCASRVNQYMNSNSQLSELAAAFGASWVASELTNFIDIQSGSETCVYPDNATPVCTTYTPCGWECSSPYVAVGDVCECTSPMTICNGVCGMYPTGCGSSVSLPARRQHQARALIGAMTLADAQLTCEADQVVCGVYNHLFAYECLDINTNLESCGGCTIANPYLDGADAQNAPVGTDCTALTNVEDVACVSGQCVVNKCKGGFKLDIQSNLCVEYGTTLRLNSQNYIGRSL